MAASIGKMTRSLAYLLVIAVFPAAASAQLPREENVLAFTDSVRPGNVSAGGAPFTESQLQFNRVRDARLEMRYGIKKLFRERGLQYPAAEAYVRIFKRERELELWVRPSVNEPFALLRTYDICALSGELGPKRQQGDGQVPEGFYSIDNFNPYSDYHLSLHINYPNESDERAGKHPDPGGNIFIHGGCNSIGCLALTDEGIKELYWIAVEARAAGQKKIPVDIFPTRLTNEAYAQLQKTFSRNPSLVAFWGSLKPAYDFFEKTRRLPAVRVDQVGRYVVNNVVPPAPSKPGAPAPLGRPLGAPADASVKGVSNLQPSTGMAVKAPAGKTRIAPLGKPFAPGARN